MVKLHHGLRLSGKLILVLSGLLILSQVVFSVFYTYQTAAHLAEQHKTRLASFVQTISNAVAIDVWNFNPDTLELVIAPYLLDPAIKAITLSDFQGNQVTFSQNEQQQIQRSASKYSGSQLQVSDITIALSGETSKVGTLELATDRSYIDDALKQQLWRRLIELLVMNLLLASVLVLTLSKMVLVPLHKLNQALSSAISSRDGRVDNPLVGLHDEFEDVAKNIELLASRLAEDVNIIRASQQQSQRERDKAEQALLSLRHTQDALIQSEKLASLGAMVAGVAHEVNTPVGVVITSSTCSLELLTDLQTAVQNNQLSRQHLIDTIAILLDSANLIYSNAQRAANLIDNFKLVAQDQSVEGERRFELGAYLKDTLHSLQNLIDNSKVRVSVAFEPNLWLETSPGLFSQILTNLLSNVIHHAYPGRSEGWCHLSLKREHDELVLRCQDGGRGIASHLQNKIFDPFFTTSLGHGSSGLGLAIVFRIVHVNLRGQISVHSELDHGTEFIIRFPYTEVRG